MPSDATVCFSRSLVPRAFLGEACEYGVCPGFKILGETVSKADEQ